MLKSFNSGIVLVFVIETGSNVTITAAMPTTHNATTTPKINIKFDFFMV